jgi:hypothetical protein
MIFVKANVKRDRARQHWTEMQMLVTLMKNDAQKKESVYVMTSQRSWSVIGSSHRWSNKNDLHLSWMGMLKWAELKSYYRSMPIDLDLTLVRL